MNSLTHALGKSLALAALAIGLQACSASTDPTTEIASASMARPAGTAGPALWKVADDDTTIYLFGTVHALPKDVEWMTETISTALTSSNELVTEIGDVDPSDPATQQKTLALAALADGTTLRSKLDDEQRARYEAALTSLELPVAAFDPFEPWFAGMTMATLPLFKSGYDPNSGVEKIIESKAEGKQHTALETVDFQLSVFDSLPEQTQIAFLMTGVDNMDRLVPMLDSIVAEWAEGDVEELGTLVFSTASDNPEVTDAIFYNRNRNWTDWIDGRLEDPGTVFIAVGAGHLAGDKSVQAYLQQRGIAVTRVQ